MQHSRSRGRFTVSFFEKQIELARGGVGIQLLVPWVCGGSGHRLSTCWGLRLGADDPDGGLRKQCSDGADGGEERSHNGTDGSDGYGNLDEGVAVLVLHNDALDVAFVDQGADLIDEVAAQDMNFFHNIIEIHSVDYVVTYGQVPRQLNSEYREAALPVVDPRASSRTQQHHQKRPSS